MINMNDGKGVNNERFRVRFLRDGKQRSRRFFFHLRFIDRSRSIALDSGRRNRVIHIDYRGRREIAGFRDLTSSKRPVNLWSRRDCIMAEFATIGGNQ